MMQHKSGGSMATGVLRGLLLKVTIKAFDTATKFGFIVRRR